MSEINKDKEKKRGFLPWISNLFKGKTPMAQGGMGTASGAGRAAGLGRAAMGGAQGLGGAASGLGSSGGGWLGGLFATKAGIVGMVLGGATIAAGIGVIYNFVGPSSKAGNAQQLFQNAYLDEQSQSASMDRSKQRNASVDGSLDMFKEQAKKDGLALGEEGAGDAAKTDEKPADAAADGSAEAPGVPGDGAGANPMGGGPKLAAAGGFGSKGGGGGTSIPAMSGGGGMSGGINSKFSSIYKAPAGRGGKTSGMGAKTAGITGGAKYSVPGSKKGAFGQAKFAGKMGNKAAYSADGAGARTAATEAFSGETAGTGDVGAPGGGAGLGGAGLSGGNKLKSSDPSTNGSSFTPPTPTVGEPTDVSPWNDLRDEALKYILIGMGLVILTKILGKIAKAVPFMYYAALITAVGAMLAGLKVIMIGIKLWKGDPNGKPPWTGQMGLAIPMILAGVVIIMQAWNALCDAGAQQSYTDAKGNNVDMSKGTLKTEGGNSMFSSDGGKTFNPVTNANPLSGLAGMGLGNVLGGM